MRRYHTTLLRALATCGLLATLASAAAAPPYNFDHHPDVLSFRLMMAPA